MSTSTRVPVVRSGQALNSLRDSGYDLPTALGEPIDNSLEANANHVWVRLDESANSRGKKHIHRIVIADDGEGMDEHVLQHYLQLGFGTRYMRTDTIGKYGVGAKLAALNYGKRIDVWSRDNAEGDWMHVHFDLDDAMKEEESGDSPGIDPPKPMAIPKELDEMIPKGTGTVVVWSKVDRLEEGRRAPDSNQLRVEVEKELSRIFRYFLHDGIVIRINDRDLIPHDPLMLMERSWCNAVLKKHLAKGDDEKAKKKDQFSAEVIHDEPVAIEGHKARVRVTLYPRESIGERGAGADKLRKELRIPENEGQVSFVRLNREVSYTLVARSFPKGVKFGDRYIGVEVSFSPELDDYFGIRNVKRGVEPHGELRDKLRKALNNSVETARSKLEEIWGVIHRESQDKRGEHAPVMDKVKEADRTMPKSRAKGPESEDERRGKLEDLAKDVIGPGDEKKEEREEYLERIEDQPFVIESVDVPGTFFIDVQHLSGQSIIRLNTRHRFYREMWEPLREIAQRGSGTVSGDEAVAAARRTIEALTLLIIAYAKAESMDEHPMERYGELRSFWGMFADSLMNKVKGVV